MADIPKLISSPPTRLLATSPTLAQKRRARPAPRRSPANSALPTASAARSPARPCRYVPATAASKGASLCPSRLPIRPVKTSPVPPDARPGFPVGLIIVRFSSAMIVYCALQYHRHVKALCRRVRHLVAIRLHFLRAQSHQPAHLPRVRGDDARRMLTFQRRKLVRAGIQSVCIQYERLRRIRHESADQLRGLGVPGYARPERQRCPSLPTTSTHGPRPDCATCARRSRAAAGVIASVSFTSSTSFRLSGQPDINQPAAGPQSRFRPPTPRRRSCRPIRQPPGAGRIRPCARS